MHKLYKSLALQLVVSVAVAGAVHAAEGKRFDQPLDSKMQSCNRHCLLLITSAYTEALIDNDLSHVPLAKDVRATSNGTVVAPGHAEIWGKATRLPFRQVFVDPATGASVFYAMAKSDSDAQPQADAAEDTWLYVVRLKVVDRKISEIEEITYQPKKGEVFFGGADQNLSVPDRLLDSVLPQSERVSRQQLFAAADRYFDAIGKKLDANDVGFYPECQRLENGLFTTNGRAIHGSCIGELNHVANFKWNVENRRYYIADEERGVVVAAATFMAPADFPKNNQSVVIEVFKVQDGLIRHLEAFFKPLSTTAGWPAGK